MKRLLLVVAVLLIILASAIAWRYHRWIREPNTQAGHPEVVLLYDSSGYDQLYQALVEQKILIKPVSFKWVAKRMDFGDKSIKSGRYVIPPGLSNYDLIQKFRLGQQDPVDLVISTAIDMHDLAGKISRQIALDSQTLIQYIDSVYLPSSSYTPETILSLFIPNTYEVWWNITPDKLLARMETEHSHFWDETNRHKAQDIGLNPEEVYTLASIVESETQDKPERPAIAGVYLNRLRLGIPLQADPTVRFALQDRSIRRILHKHLAVVSPYNTYIHTGLPPGPISMPSINSIEAVLNPAKHDYLYFCAKPGNGGKHAFAHSLSAHLANARAYQAWLNQQEIR